MNKISSKYYYMLIEDNVECKSTNSVMMIIDIILYLFVKAMERTQTRLKSGFARKIEYTSTDVLSL